MTHKTVPKRRALVIGISDYAKLEPLVFCKNDGQEVFNILLSLGYDIEDNNLLVGHVRWQRMRDSIYNFFNNEMTAPEDTLLFYYSGHGIPDSDEDVYLATSEIDPNQPSKRGFNFNELTKIMRESVSTRVVSILDCCYSGSAKLSKGHEDDVAKLGKSTMSKQSEMLGSNIGEGICLLAACQAQQEAYALEEQGHSVFTYYILQALKGNAKQAIDDFGYLTADSLARYIFNTIMSLPVEKRPRQKPVTKLEASGDIILAHYPKFARTLRVDHPSHSLDTSSLIEKGNEYINSKEYQKALDYYQKVIKDPNYSKAWNNKGIALGNLKRFDEALRSFEVSLEMDSNNINARTNKGITLYNLGRYDEALDCFNEAIKLDIVPDTLIYANAWFYRGASFYQKGRQQEALECYDKAIEINPNAELALAFKGDLYLGQRKLDQALDCYDKAIEIDPQSSLPWNSKAKILVERKRFAEALECYDKAIQVFQTNRFVTGLEAIWGNKGLALSQMGKYPEAIECYDKAIEINSNNPIFWINKAKALATLSRYDESLKCYDKAIEINPKNNLAWNDKAVTLIMIRRYDEAMACLDNVIKLDPNQAIIWDNKAFLLNLLGRYREAIECYDKSLSLNPDNEITLKNKQNAVKSMETRVSKYNSDGKIADG